MRDDVCLVSTWNVQCGIAGFTAGLQAALNDHGIATSILELDRVALEDMPRGELGEAMTDLGRQSAAHRTVHVQHDFGLFRGAYGRIESIRNLHRFLKAARRGPERIVLTFHAMPPLATLSLADPLGLARDQLISRLWRRLVVPLVDGRQVVAIAPSRYQRRLLIDSGIPADAITVVPQGVPDLRADAFDSRQAKEELGLDPDARIVVQFGFIAAHKGHLVALEAMSALPQRYRLAVVGGVHPHAIDDLTYDSFVKEMLEQPRVASRVRITGWVPDSDVSLWLAAADLCIVPYTTPDIPTSAAAIWALSSGRPVIATRIPAFAELANEWGCFEMVSSGSAYELAESAIALERDQQRVKQLVENAERLCAAWAWPVAAEAHARLYHRR